MQSVEGCGLVCAAGMPSKAQVTVQQHPVVKDFHATFMRCIAIPEANYNCSRRNCDCAGWKKMLGMLL